jgi:uncharacterized membrane protein
MTNGRNSWTRGVLATIAGTSTVPLSTHAQSIRYTAEPIDLPAWFWPTAMNSSRTIVGSYYPPGDQQSQAAAWRQGQFTPLGHPELQSTRLNTINDAGHAAGVRYSTYGPWIMQALEWTGGELVDLPAVEGYDSTAVGINQHGVICGTHVDDEMFRAAVVWDNGPPAALGRVEWSKALAINDLGDVVVDQWFPGGLSVRRTDGSRRELETLEDAYWPSDYSLVQINNSGQVAARDVPDRIAFWDAQGRLSIIAEGRMDTSFAGLDEAGRVVWSELHDGVAEYDVRLWEDGVEVSINDLIDGFDARVEWSYALNSLGEILVGTSAGGYYVLVPVPSPAGATCVLGPACWVLVRRRRRSSACQPSLVGVSGCARAGVVGVAVATCGSPVSAAPPRYRAEPFLMPVGFEPSAMNASRVIAGATYDDHGRYRAAVLEGGVVTELGPSDATHSILSDINDAGVGVGTWWTAADYSNRGFLWQPGGPPQLLPRYDMPDSASSAWGINHAGQVAGAVWGANTPFAACWDTPDAPATVLAQLSWSGSEAYDINDHGDSLGADRWGDNLRIWHPDGSFELMPGSDDHWIPYARLNNAGDVLIRDGYDTVVLRTASGDVIPVFDGWTNIEFLAIDDAGHVVWGAVPPGEYLFDIWVWDRGQTSKLDDLVEGFDGNVWGASVMNAAGEIVVNTNLGWRILTPVPGPGVPASVALLAVTCTARRARRGFSGGAR